jgi:hypothetical protein
MVSRNPELERLGDRLRAFAKKNGVKLSEVVSVKIRPVRANGEQIWRDPGDDPTYKNARTKAGVQDDPNCAERYFGRALRGGDGTPFRISNDAVWIEHETGLEIIGLVLGVIGAIEPTYKGIKWLVDQLAGQGPGTKQSSRVAAAVRLELRFIRESQLIIIIVEEQVETLINSKNAYIAKVRQWLKTVVSVVVYPLA